MNGMGVAFLFAIMMASCQGNVAEGTVDLSKPSRAKSALDNLEFDTAIQLYEELIVEQPSAFEYLALAATAYAGRAGADILDIATGDFSGEGTLTDTIGDFVPREPSRQQLDDIAAAVALLQAIPLVRVDASLQASAKVQLGIYLTVKATMLINSFSKLTASGQLDPTTLDQMTEEDATEILDSLQAAAEISDDPELKSKIEGMLAGIDAGEGASSDEKLKDFLQSQ